LRVKGRQGEEGESRDYIDDNDLINQLLAPLEVGHEFDTKANARNFVFYKPVSVANSWWKIPVS
jgi:hypothetical protein